MTDLKICILTSQHPTRDVRIYQKEIYSLLKRYKEIYLISKSEEGLKLYPGVIHVGINNRPGLFYRLLRNIEIFAKAVKVNARVYHLHDPDLIYVGVVLKVLFRKKIIYDIHEYFVDIIRHRNYLNKSLARILSNIYKFSEKLILPFFDLLILAEESYYNFYEKHHNVVIVQNFIKSEYVLKEGQSFSSEEKLDVVFLGGITTQRGIWETLELFKILNNRYNARLHLIGSFESEELQKKVLQKMEQEKLLGEFVYYGYVQHEQVIKLIRDFDIGVFLLHPIKNYTTSLPTKLFEFMGNGLSVICSDFDKLTALNKEIGFGLTVNIFNLEAEKNRIFDFIDNKASLASSRIKNIETVRKHYLWEYEEKKLLQAYEELS